MNLTNYCWIFTSVIPPKLCDDIVKYSLTKKENIALTGGFTDKDLSNDQLKVLKEKRDSDVVWLDETWIYKELHPYINIANRNAGWNFQWDFSETIQFTKYKINQYYDWHCDSWDNEYNTPENLGTHKKIRKISMTCQLSDGSQYKGGELEFDFRNYDPHMRDESEHIMQFKETLPKGSIVVFPSFVWHRVKPVTEGTRYSLVMWNLGYPYK